MDLNKLALQEWHFNKYRVHYLNVICEPQTLIKLILNTYTLWIFAFIQHLSYMWLHNLVNAKFMLQKLAVCKGYSMLIFDFKNAYQLIEAKSSDHSVQKILSYISTGHTQGVRVNTLFLVTPKHFVWNRTGHNAPASHPPLLWLSQALHCINNNIYNIIFLRNFIRFLQHGSRCCEAVKFH